MATCLTPMAFHRVCASPPKACALIDESGNKAALLAVWR